MTKPLLAFLFPAVAGLMLTTLHAGEFTDDFNRDNADGAMIGNGWNARGPMSITDNMMQIVPDASRGQGSVEAISETEETASVDGRSFEISCDVKMDPHARGGIVFNFDAPSTYELYLESNSAVFMASKNAERTFDKNLPLSASIQPGTWYNLKVASSSPTAFVYTISTVGGTPTILGTGTVTLPEAYLTTGYGGVQAAGAKVVFDNFSVKTSP